MAPLPHIVRRDPRLHVWRELLVIALAAVGLGTRGVGAGEACENETYAGYTGRWETVVATAYSPADPIDSAYHATKGAWRWITADGRTDVRKKPYGIAVPLGPGTRRPMIPFGTKFFIDPAACYPARGVNGPFTVDDVGAGRQYFRYDRSGRLHVDLRFRTHAAALAWAGPTGRRVIRVFHVTGVAVAMPRASEPEPPLPVARAVPVYTDPCTAQANPGTPEMPERVYPRGRRVVWLLCLTMAALSAGWVWAALRADLDNPSPA